ncbi:MAG: hypothetical protein PHD60_01590 [Clostridia bacterium]|nr:hypothetical protein [Clostridia bacterium]
MYLWDILMKDKETGEKIHLKVPGNTVDEATRKVTSIGCFGINGPYVWVGSGPIYDNQGNCITID